MNINSQNRQYSFKNNTVNNYKENKELNNNITDSNQSDLLVKNIELDSEKDTNNSSEIICNDPRHKNIKKDTFSSRLAKGAASFLVPGLGQFCDGRNKEGSKHFFTTMGLNVVGFIPIIYSYFKFIKNTLKNIEDAPMIKFSHHEMKDIQKNASSFKFAATMAISYIFLSISNMVMKFVSAADAMKGSGKNNIENT